MALSWLPYWSTALATLASAAVIGSLLFGIGWGMVGFCPGPAISSIALLKPLSLLFVGSMIVGFYLSQLFNK